MLTAAISLASCEKIVDVQPQNTILPSQALADITGYQGLLISVYDRLQSYTYWGRDMVLMGDALADNIFTVTGQSGGRYNGQNINTRGSSYGIWTASYAGINDLNTILTGIDNLTGLNATQTTLKNQIKAEAYAIRGLYYFDLARVYGYEPNTIPATGTGAGFNKSAIIRLTPTNAVGDADMRNRNTIIETYTQVESDMLQAISLFQGLGSTKPTNPYRFSESATHGFLAKVYLYWQRYADCVTQCQAALNTTICPGKLTPAGTYSQAFKSVPNPESLMELNYVQSVEVVGVTGSNDAPYTYTQPTGYGFPGVINGVSTFAGQTVSAELLASFETVDDRKAMFYNSRTATTATVYTWCNKYSGNNGAYTDNIPMLRYSDVLLMQAEALAAQGQYLPAQTLVQQLRVARNAVLPTPADATLPAFIQAERRRELFFEGQRFFDLKRLGAGITKAALTNVGTIPSTDYRLLASLPASEVLFNPALPQNPNY